MPKQMAPQKKKFDINPSESTPQHTALLSPGIENSSTLSKLSMSLGPDTINP